MAYLVLDNRNLKLGESSTSTDTKSKLTTEDVGGTKAMTNGESTVKGKEKDESVSLEQDDEIEFIEPPSGTTSLTSNVNEDGQVGSTRPGKRKREREREREQYQTLAVRPANSIVPMLHNLLSPFVLGVTKSARQVSP